MSTPTKSESLVMKILRAQQLRDELEALEALIEDEREANRWSLVSHLSREHMILLRDQMSEHIAATYDSDDE